MSNTITKTYRVHDIEYDIEFTLGEEHENFDRDEFPSELIIELELDEYDVEDTELIEDMLSDEILNQTNWSNSLFCYDDLTEEYKINETKGEK